MLNALQLASVIQQLLLGTGSALGVGPTAFESRWGFPKLSANPCSFKGQPLPRTEQEEHRLKPEESQGGPKPSLGLIARSRGVFSNAALGHALVLGLGRRHQHLDLAFVWGVECGMFGFLGG